MDYKGREVMEKNDRSGMEKAAAPEMADWDCDIAYFVDVGLFLNTQYTVKERLCGCGSSFCGVSERNGGYDK